MGVAIQKIIANQDADMPDLKSANQDASLEQEAVVDREDQLDGSVLSAEHQEDQLGGSVLSAEHQEDQLDGSVLSAEHQMVMSWCWLNIRVNIAAGNLNLFTQRKIKAAIYECTWSYVSL